MAVGAGYRNYFTAPVRLGQGLQVASGRGGSASNIINTAGNYLESAGSVFLNFNSRQLAASSIVVGVSGTDTALTAIRVYSSTLGSGSISANSVTQSSFTVTGLATSDKIICIIPPNSGISSGGAASLMGIAYAMVSAADTLTVGWLNPTAVANTRTSGTYTIVAVRS